MVCLYVGYKSQVFGALRTATECVRWSVRRPPGEMLEIFQTRVLGRRPSLEWGMFVVAQWVV